MNALVDNGPALLFYVFGALALVSAVGVVTLRNPMYGAISLLTSFLSVAVLFLLRSAEFLAMVQIFVYGGGIMVLFLFVIMLINLHRLAEVKKFSAHMPVVALLVVLMIGVFGWFFLQTGFGPAFTQPDVFDHVGGVKMGNPEAVAMALYSPANLVPFEVASIFLLIAMIGAVTLGRRQ